LQPVLGQPFGGLIEQHDQRRQTEKQQTAQRKIARAGGACP
jgi:hypothetical protein